MVLSSRDGKYQAVVWRRRSSRLSRARSSDTNGDGPGFPWVAVAFAGIGTVTWRIGSRTMKSVEEAIEYIGDETAVNLSEGINFGIHLLFGTVYVLFIVVTLYSVYKFGRRYRSDTAGDGPGDGPPAARRAKSAERSAVEDQVISDSRARATAILRRERPRKSKSESKNERSESPPSRMHRSQMESSSYGERELENQITALSKGEDTIGTTLRKESGASSSSTIAEGVQSSSSAKARAAAVIGGTPSRTTCGAGLGRFLPTFRPSARSSPAATTNRPPAVEEQRSSSEEVKSLRLAKEAADLRAYRRDLDTREKELGEGWKSVEQSREQLRAREKAIAMKEEEIARKEQVVFSREDLLGVYNNSLGAMTEVMSAADTCRAWIRLIEASKKTVLMMFYTFDLDILCTALEAAKRRGVLVKLLGDKQRVQSTKGTQQLMQRLKGHRVEIRLRDGQPLAHHYTTGQSASSGLIRDKNGIVHAKFLYADSQLIVGSTNFTTSSQCNVESSCHLILNPAGEANVAEYFNTAFAEAEEF